MKATAHSPKTCFNNKATGRSDREAGDHWGRWRDSEKTPRKGTCTHFIVTTLVHMGKDTCSAAAAPRSNCQFCSTNASGGACFPSRLNSRARSGGPPPTGTGAGRVGLTPPGESSARKKKQGNRVSRGERKNIYKKMRGGSVTPEW
jgi:hypothetical protein